MIKYVETTAVLLFASNERSLAKSLNSASKVKTATKKKLRGKFYQR